MKPEAVDFALAEFGRQLSVALETISSEMDGLKRKREDLQQRIDRLVEAIEQQGSSPALRRALGDRERELQEIDDSPPVGWPRFNSTVLGGDPSIRHRASGQP